ncbi:MAG: hypothetical protein ACKPHL_03100 [Dolichospermum sp.]
MSTAKIKFFAAFCVLFPVPCSLFPVPCSLFPNKIPELLKNPGI